MSGDAGLRAKAQEAIQTGKFPNRAPARTWAGQGSGASRCAICDQLVRADEIEYELEFAAGNDGVRPDAYYLHGDCYWAWEFERRDLTQKGGIAKATPLSGDVRDIKIAVDEREGRG